MKMRRRVIVMEVLVKIIYGVYIFIMLFTVAFIGVIVQYEFETWHRARKRLKEWKEMQA